MTAPARQLDAIHAMLAAGHRNLRIERHTLLLWGIPAGLLFAVSELILTPAQFPDLTERALAWLGLLVAVLVSIATLDWFWTRQIKATRDEAWSLIHRQVLKVLWLMMGLATLTTFAMFFYGGGYMLCAVWLVFLGISLYVHGLFSEELLEWAGLLTILIGIASLLARLPYETMRWVAAAVFGLGLPLLALMLDRGRHRPAHFRLAQMLGWLSVVLILPVTVEQRIHHRELPDLAAVSLADYRAGKVSPTGDIAVALPAGTAIPVDVELGGDIFGGSGANPVLPLTLNQPIELLLRDGQLTGDVRFPGEPWQESRQVRWLSIPWLKADLTPERGPRVTGNLVVQLRSQ
jgi:hypothetical protein